MIELTTVKSPKFLLLNEEAYNGLELLFSDYIASSITSPFSLVEFKEKPILDEKNFRSFGISTGSVKCFFISDK